MCDNNWNAGEAATVMRAKFCVKGGAVNIRTEHQHANAINSESTTEQN